MTNKTKFDQEASDLETIEKLEDKKYAKRWVQQRRKKSQKRIAFITGLAIKEANSTAALKNLLQCGIRIGSALRYKN